ncbi:hypothetical protein IGJ02_002518 [Enterococcus sp. DIV0724b]|uniref:hypothetical protein n=1 Tax=Enterococcus sp. DIV0724b TaxID=2774694 RepID=UPI003D2FA55C
MIEKIHKIVSSDFYNDLKNISEFFSFLVAIIGIIAIFVSVKQLKSEQKKMIDDQKDKKSNVQYKQKEKAIEILEFFANDLIPQIDEYIRKSNKELSGIESLRNESIEKQQMILLLVKKDCGAGYIFNQLEHVCLNICAGLADEDMIYYPLSKIIIGFVDNNKNVYEDLLNEAPYKYLTQVYARWTNKEKLEVLEKESEEIESKKMTIMNQMEKNN